MIPANPVDNDVRWSWLMKAAFKDLFPDGPDDLVDQEVP
jgi:hypothetical protein